MAGKVLGLGAAGLSQVLIWVVAGRVLLAVVPSVFTDVELVLPGFALAAGAVAFFVLGYLMFATLNAGLGAISPTARESQQLAIFVAAPLIIPIYAWVYIVENPTAGIVRVLTFFPLTSSVVVLERLERLGPESIEAWGVALAFVVSALSVTVAIFWYRGYSARFYLATASAPACVCCYAC
jgi:ABC-2 type transport system permease protein